MARAEYSAFVMSETTRDQIKVLPREMQLKFFWAVTDFGIDGIEPNFDGIELAIWIPMRDLILNSKRKDEIWHTKQQKNGRQGGRPKRKPEDGETQANPEVFDETQNNPNNPWVSGETQANPEVFDETQKTHNMNINKNINKNKNKNKSDSVFFDENPPLESSVGPPGDDPPDNKPIETKEDAITVWNKARVFWNEKGLKPECRDLMMRAVNTAEILQTFQFYSWIEIRNAIGNYAWHKFKAGSEYRPPPPYLSLAGFLKTGVEKYYDDDSIDHQFKEVR
jgi:hypothetical protein